jgi:hypothetical protein
MVAGVLPLLLLVSVTSRYHYRCCILVKTLSMRAKDGAAVSVGSFVSE